MTEKVMMLRMPCFALAIIIVVLVGSASSDSDVTFEITAEVMPAIDVYVPESLSYWVINPTIAGTYKLVGNVIVSSNTDWSLFVKEDDGDGKMSHGDKILKKNLEVKVDRGPSIDISSEFQEIASGVATKETNLTITCLQEVHKNEAIGENYGITITFIGRNRVSQQ